MVLPLALLLQLIFSRGHQLGIVTWGGDEFLELKNLIMHSYLATCCIVVNQDSTALFYQGARPEFQTCLLAAQTNRDDYQRLGK